MVGNIVWGVLSEPAYIIYKGSYYTHHYGRGELPLISSGDVFPARSPLLDFLQYKGTDNI